MAMSTSLQCLSLYLIISLVFIQSTFSASDPPQPSPSPPPEPHISSPPSIPSPSPSPEHDSPPAPPAPSPELHSPPAPAPVPDADGGVSHEDSSVTSNLKESSSGGMSGGQKAGVAFGVIAGACVVIVGGVLYKKRQNNIRRSQFGYGSRVEMI